MEADRFERVVRVLTTASSRRQTVGGLVGTLLGGVLGHGPLVATAKGKKGKKGKGKKKRGPATPPPPTCGPGTKLCNGQCIATTTCCGGCPAASICETGVCVRCEIGLSVCSNTCTDLSSDSANCGGCGIVCDPGDVCIAGGCQDPE
jgi:hypothetical protein